MVSLFNKGHRLFTFEWCSAQKNIYIVNLLLYFLSLKQGFKAKIYLNNLQRNIFTKGENRVILGEIGFKHEIDLFRKDPKYSKNILYYPNEYFNEDIDNISLSFDIWSLGVVYWEILTQKKLFTKQSDIQDDSFIAAIQSPGICAPLEELVLK
jgi:hypothetical protein